METKTSSRVSPVYNDFEPSTEWVQEEGYDSLLVFLPGELVIPTKKKGGQINRLLLANLPLSPLPCLFMIINYYTRRAGLSMLFV